MKVIFLGTPEFAKNVLEEIVTNSKHEVVCVVCQPSKPSGRGNKTIDPPAKVFADAHGIPVHQFEKIRLGGAEVLSKYGADIVITAAYGQILRDDILHLCPYGVINVHGSLLPKLRGAAPIQWAIITGEKKTGVTIMRTEAGVDTGDMLLAEETTIGEDETSKQLFERLSVIGGKLASQALDLIESGNAKFTPQNNELASVYPIIKKEMGKIDFNKTAKEVNCLVRGLNPWPIAYFTLKDEKVIKVYSTKVLDGDFGARAGTIVSASPKKGLIIACGEGAIEITSLSGEGTKIMDAKSFLNGRKLTEGEIID